MTSPAIALPSSILPQRGQSDAPEATVEPQIAPHNVWHGSCCVSPGIGSSAGALMEIGVFIPIGNNGWLISSTSPQYTPTFDLNREVVQRAERYGFDFALSMIKLRGFGG